MTDSADAARWVVQVLEAIPCGVVVSDAAGVVVMANARARSLASAAGLSAPLELLGRSVPADRLVVERQALGDSGGCELTLVWERDTKAAGEAASARVLRLEAALRELSVVSHKINNPITALLGRAQMLRARPHPDALVEKSVAVIDESAARITELAKELSKLLKEARRDSVDALLASESRQPAGFTTPR